MAQYKILDPEDMLQCPYDRVHMVRAKRFQYHLMKCRKNYTGNDYVQCPFNAKHELPKPELRHHLTVCPDKAVLEPEISYSQRKEMGEMLHKGCTDLPVSNGFEVYSDENWDNEVSAPVGVGPMNDETYFTRVKFQDHSRLNKTQRAVMNDHRLTTQQKMGELRQYSAGRGQAAWGPGPHVDDDLRLPKSASQAAAMSRQPQFVPKEQPMSSVFAYSIGRGSGAGQPTPANGSTEHMNGTASAADVTGQTPAMPYQGVGRGIGRGIGRGAVAPPPGFCVPNVNARLTY